MKTNGLSLFSLNLTNIPLNFHMLFSQNIKLIVTTILVSVFTVSYGQYSVGESTGYANAGLSLQNSWAMTNNPAGIAGVEKLEVGMYYNSRFSTKEMSTKGLVFATPLQGGSIGVLVNSYGYSLYSKNSIGIAYARTLSDKINAGVRIQYHSLKIGEGYGKSDALTVSIGMQYEMDDHITISGVVYNPNKSSFVDYNDEKIPSLLKGGLKYTFSDKVFITTEVWASSDNKPQVVVGSEYQILDKLFIRAGVSTQPTASAFGFGVKLKQFDINFNSAYDPYLGFSPSFSLLYHGE